MANKVTYAIKIKAIIALAMPLLYFLMFLPIWNGNELKIIPIDVIDIIQIASLLIAVINLYLVFVKKDVKNQTFFTVVMVISALLTCFFGVFFVEKLMGIPLFPPQDWRLACLSFLLFLIHILLINNWLGVIDCLTWDD